MTDPPEVKAAQEALDRAVREMVRVCAEQGDHLIGDETTPAHVAGYILIVDGVSYSEEGNTVTSIGHVYDGGEMPLPQAVGLLKLGMWSLLEGPVDDD